MWSGSGTKIIHRLRDDISNAIAVELSARQGLKQRQKKRQLANDILMVSCSRRWSVRLWMCVWIHVHMHVHRASCIVHTMLGCEFVGVFMCVHVCVYVCGYVDDDESMP